MGTTRRSTHDAPSHPRRGRAQRSVAPVHFLLLYMSTPRVLITDEAATVIDQLRETHGPLMFHQSGGCCDGSSPMCYAEGDFRLGRSDVKLGEVHGVPFYMEKSQFEYWKHTQLTVGVKPGRGSSFSIEIPLGLRFLIDSRLYTEEEAEALAPVERVDA